jgi:peptidoglycan/LPS O-acetylase OafA/YrhL
MRLTYHPKIDGLQAIAAVAVIFYYAQISIFGYQPFKVGFIKFDVFQ